jgi:hypothetical protein
MTTTIASAADLKPMLLCSRADYVCTGHFEPLPLALNYDKEQPR